MADAALAAFAALGHGLALWSADGLLVTGNPAFHRRFDCFGGEVPAGTAQTGLLEAAERSGLLVRSTPAQGAPETLLEARHMLGGRTLIFSDGMVARVESWPAADGLVVTLFADVTEAKRSERLLEKARDAAAAADQSKSRFLRAANHDLRQPLASLKILIYSCMAAESEEQRQETLHAMDVSVAIMEELLGALLNIGQLDAGKVEPNVQTFQLSTVFDRLRVQFEHQAREKGLDIRIVGSRAAVESDRVLLERVLSNFVANAIRYTETGRVLIGCRRRGQMLRLEVHDSGPGIPDELRKKVFEEFYRIGDRQQDRRHSLGLGLNISQRLAEMLGHEITLRSAVGRGSCFAIDVPVGDVWHSHIGEPEINERIGGEFAGLSCLIMEDDAHLREALIRLLERWGIVVTTIEDFTRVEEAVADLDPQPDIIITDYRLRGGVQGTDLVNQVNDLLNMPCPAIVVTADTSPELIAGIRAQGFPVLIKPVSPPGLRVIMHNMLFEPELVPELT